MNIAKHLPSKMQFLPKKDRSPSTTGTCQNVILIIQSDNQGLPLAIQQEVDERGHISDIHLSVLVAVGLGNHLGIVQEHVD